MTCYRLIQAVIVGAGIAAGPLPAWAAPGDVHRVTAERANLRAGPSDDASVRGQLERGEELVELRSEGNWYGVRVTRTGEEGWIFGDLVEQVSATTLGGGGGPGSAGFLELSESFDQVLRRIDQQLGYPVAKELRQGEQGTLRVTANPEWLRATSRDAHLMAALATYQMWKNHQNNAPVQVILLDGEEAYITIADEAAGPRLTVAPEASG